MTIEPGNDKGNFIAWTNLQPKTIPNEQYSIRTTSPYGGFRQNPGKCVTC